MARELLIKGLNELKLITTEKQLEQLLTFIALMAKWNKTYNLTAIKQLNAMVGLHLLDSLAIAPFITGTRVIDIATGAGLPGIPLAILLPDYDFVLLDSNSKKTSFVQQAILELKLTNVRIIHSRVEAYQPEKRFNTLTARAFAPLALIQSSSAHLLNDDGIILAMKAQISDSELAAIKNYQLINLTVPFINAARCVVQLTKS